MHTSTVPYELYGQEMKGFLAYDDSYDAARPAVVVAHAWRGLDDFAREKAVALAKMGYVAFAADLYGDGINATDDDEALQLMLPLFRDRKLLQERIGAAVDEVRKCPFTDSDKIGAIGFCFGGLTVLELIRSGKDVRCAVSFHGVLADVLGNVRAKRPVNAPRLNGSILFLHGHDDPMVSPTDITAVQDELDEADVDWTFVTYSQTVHAFTNKMANAPDQGTVYMPRSARRSWLTMENYLTEQFAKEKEIAR